MYDLSVIGAGWAGFNAAVRAHKLGLKVCLIEKGKIGGTCLNSGCIPTKTLLQSAKVFSTFKKSASFGIETTSPQITLALIQQRKNKIIQQLASGMQSKLKDIEYLNAEAKFISPTELDLGDRTIHARNFLIASGSRAAELPFLRFDGTHILTSEQLLNLSELPQSLLIIGGGVIGCEFASLFVQLGVKVAIAEKTARLLPGEDQQAARKIESAFKKRGITVLTNADASAIALGEYTKVLVSIGRIPNTDGLNLEGIGVRLEQGRIAVDDYLRTSVGNIYAAGDCTGRVMLAHYAAYQGRVVADNIAAGKNTRKEDSRSVPNCIFTDPEIASVGLNEEKARALGLDIEVRELDFLASGMARILDETEGFVKIVVDKKSQEILGGIIVGARATELIAVIAVACANHLKADDIKATIFAHPTVSESIEGALEG